MIVLKRNCNSSIRDCDGSECITFGAFTIQLTDWSYRKYKAIKDDLSDTSENVLASIITAGIEALWGQIISDDDPDDDPDRCPYGGTCSMPGCDCYNDCPRYPHGGDDW